MDATALGITAILISLLSLSASILLTVWQFRLMRRSYYVSFVTNHISEFRKMPFYDDLVYVTTKLPTEHDRALGVSGLPPEIRAALLNVAYFYQSFAWLIELGVLQKEPSVRSIGERICLVWSAIKPYVEAEREIVPGPFLELLERVHRACPPVTHISESCR